MENNDTWCDAPIWDVLPSFGESFSELQSLKYAKTACEQIQLTLFGENAVEIQVKKH